MKNKTIYSFDNPHFKKGKSETIFTICGIEKFKHPSLKRIFGWHSKLSKAIGAVTENKSDLYECAYKYIVIEEVKEGVFGMACKEWWFKWDYKKEKFLSIPKPKETNNIVNWGIG